MIVSEATLRALVSWMAACEAVAMELMMLGFSCG